MVYDGFYCYFLSTCQVDCEGDLVVHFTMFMPNVGMFYKVQHGNGKQIKTRS
jgi:hypothetical protein